MLTFIGHLYNDLPACPQEQAGSTRKIKHAIMLTIEKLRALRKNNKLFP